MLRRFLIFAATLVGIGASIALGQQLVQQALTGNEAVLIQGGGPGGPGAFTNVAALRNGSNYQPLAGTTTTATVSPTVGNVIVTGAITTLNLSLPSVPYDGQMVNIACPGGSVTTLTISAPFGGTVNGLGQTLNPATVITGTNPTACTTWSATAQVSASFKFTYQATPSVWFRIE